MAVNDLGGCISSGAQGKVCLVRGVGGMRRRFM